MFGFDFPVIRLTYPVCYGYKVWMQPEIAMVVHPIDRDRDFLLLPSVQALDAGISSGACYMVDVVGGLNQLEKVLPDIGHFGRGDASGLVFLA